MLLNSKILQAADPKQEALNVLRRLTTPQFQWDTCRLTYRPATFLRGREDENGLVVTGVRGSLERPKHLISPLAIEHCFAFDASPPH
ncbi:hypothetical protein AAFC00_000655 [Neodothiora populina]|uniref:Uncharacterized protein n=1 Tax=Neodothiora populina TaxID=2781224 RepID=A0ABR3PE57_9PEZI